MSDTGLWPSFMAPSDCGDDSRCAVSAAGHRVTFADGRTSLCGTSGLWNTNLGYGNAAIAAAITDALHDASYLGLFRFENEYARRAAGELVALTGERFARVLFSTSGGAANDLTLKVLRHFHVLQRQPQRRLVAGLRGSYHGLMFGSAAVTGEDLGQRLYGVDQRLVRHVAPNDLQGLSALLDQCGEQLAGLILEPVLGTGCIPLTAEFVAAVLAGRSEYGYLVVADEVATGFGRTGPMFASDLWPEAPDIMVVSKGLTNGTCAAAAVLVNARIASTFWDAGPAGVLGHGETQAGTPPTCAAISATINEFHRLDALAAGARVALWLRADLDPLVGDHALARTVTGRGLFLGLHLNGRDGQPMAQADVPDVVSAVRSAGAIVHPGLRGIQLVPALTYTRDEVTELVSAVEKGVEAWSRNRS